MNVANVMTTGGTTEPILSGTRQLAESAAPSLNNLFALQLGNMLQTMETPQLSTGVEELQSGEAEERSDSLLAMLEQLLANGLLTPEQHEQLTSSLQASQTANGGTDDSITLPAIGTGQGHRQLVATFMQQGLAEEQAVALANLLVDGSHSDKSPQQTALRQSAEQTANWLSKLLNASSADQPQKVVQPNGTSQEVVFRAEAPKRFAETGVNRENVSTANVTMEPLRLHRAIASYQAESGVYNRQQRNQAQSVPILGHAQPMVEEKGSMTNAQAMQNVQITQPQWFAQTQAAPQTGSYHVNSQQFTQQVGHLFLTQMKLTEADGVTEAKLVLHPRSLGQVDVKITSHNGVITAYFTADTASGKEMLDTQMSQLRSALIQQGLQVDRLEVTHQSSQQQAFDFQQQKEQGRQQQNQQPSGESTTTTDEQVEFSIEALTDESASLAALRD
ncbi:flagellar hook-length control protein FliK [Brevibacillus humidisoli]|uniref:flagellar hook-length control protein FliK n=1 Tax=Brevibacillus humidisoli TaxID=2895522 RepID=UPI001E6275DD|nr:flagellar hook-length control protein FliK [Brevibacillus humidisoli]UFJ42130.1 flagellar hook-length control protein FliK [Brevibacillus humidisoli]